MKAKDQRARVVIGLDAAALESPEIREAAIYLINLLEARAALAARAAREEEPSAGGAPREEP